MHGFKKNIVLTGFMGTGKTAVGQELARRLGRRLVELDEEIEKAEGLTINEIFSRFGEPYFRDRETDMVKRFSGQDNLVISTGGGVVLRDENMTALRKNGIIVCLKAAPETIHKRTSTSDERPLLNVDDPLKKIRDLLAYRRPFYENADIVVETDALSPAEIAEEILRRIDELKGDG
ncbi:MAG: shikimate kinase [Nitrospirae bacterium]|nr:shikimate kinase [Nitrospirota bacterium]